MLRKFRVSFAAIGRASPLLVFSIAAFAAACGSSSEEAALGSSGASGSGGSSNTSPVVNPLGRARCRAPVGVSGAPQSTQEAIALLNSLPKPTSVACFLESLERPLIAYATSSAFSAQPALSIASPRLFLRLGSLWLSVVIDGESSYLIEFGEQLPGAPLRSVKGELQLPVSDFVAASDPYDRVRYGKGTGCGLCHYGETPAVDPTLVNAFSSIAFRPRPDTRVAIDSLKSAAATCNWQSEPHRCEMLSAVFDGGAVREEAFPQTMPTFY